MKSQILDKINSLEPTREKNVLHKSFLRRFSDRSLARALAGFKAFYQKRMTRVLFF